MNAAWRQFLLKSKAIIENDSVVAFKDQDARPGPGTEEVVCDLSSRGLISISGADAVSFMQGQFTTNVLEVSPSQSQRSAWCSPKGRVLVIFTLIARGDAFVLMLPRELNTIIIKRLKLYVLRSQVSIEDTTQNDVVYMGCQGKRAEILLKEFFDELPSTPYRTTQSHRGLTAVRVPGLLPRYELLGQTDSSIELWTALTERISPTTEDAWSLGDILAGVPTVGNETSDEYLPQMLNLELIGGVDFTKGCYAGQEIVARTHYLGKVKRRMYLGGVQSSSLPVLGAPLIDGKTQQTLGKIVEVVKNGDDECLTLAVASVELHQSDRIHLNSLSGPQVSLTAFPYMESTG